MVTSFYLDDAVIVRLYKDWVSTVVTPSTMVTSLYLDDSVTACSSALQRLGFDNCDTNYHGHKPLP